MATQSIYNHLLGTKDLFGDNLFGGDSEDDIGPSLFAPPDAFSRPQTAGSRRKKTAPRTQPPLETISLGDMATSKSRAYLKRGQGRDLETRRKKAESAGRRPLTAWGQDSVDEARGPKTKTKPPVPRCNFSKSSNAPSEPRDFLLRNQENVWKYEAKNSRKSAPVMEKKRGEIPRYLRKFKAQRAAEALEAAEEAARQVEEEARGARGGALMPEEERLELLNNLRGRRRAAEADFQRWSHTIVHGPKRLAYVEQLAKEMDELDGMINTLDRPVVVVLNDGRRRAW